MALRWVKVEDIKPAVSAKNPTFTIAYGSFKAVPVAMLHGVIPTIDLGLVGHEAYFPSAGNHIKAALRQNLDFSPVIPERDILDSFKVVSLVKTWAHFVLFFA